MIKKIIEWFRRIEANRKCPICGSKHCKLKSSYNIGGWHPRPPDPKRGPHIKVPPRVI